MANSSDDIRDRETLQKEYERLATDIRGIETANDKAIGLGLTIVGLGLAYGIRENLALVFIFLPVALIGVFLYGVLQYHNLFWLGGYKRAVEEKINDLAGRNVISWEALVQMRRGRVNLINVGLALVYLGVFVAVASISTERVWSAYGWKIGLPLGAVEVALAALLSLGVRRVFHGYDEALDYGRKTLLLAVSMTPTGRNNDTASPS
jgi:hypothetical protein